MKLTKLDKAVVVICALYNHRDCDETRNSNIPMARAKHIARVNKMAAIDDMYERAVKVLEARCKSNN